MVVLFQVSRDILLYTRMDQTRIQMESCQREVTFLLNII